MKKNIINWLPKKPNNLKRLFIPGDTIDAFVNTGYYQIPISSDKIKFKLL